MVRRVLRKSRASERGPHLLQLSPPLTAPATRGKSFWRWIKVRGRSEIMNFLMSYVGKFDMYVEDDYATFVRYCFEDPLDAAIFRSRFEPKVERFKLTG